MGLWLTIGVHGEDDVDLVPIEQFFRGSIIGAVSGTFQKLGGCMQGQFRHYKLPVGGRLAGNRNNPPLA